MSFKADLFFHCVHAAAILGNWQHNLAAYFTCLIGSVCFSPRTLLCEYEMTNCILCIQHGPVVWIIKSQRTFFPHFFRNMSHQVKNPDLNLWSAKAWGQCRLHGPCEAGNHLIQTDTTVEGSQKVSKCATEQFPDSHFLEGCFPVIV